MKAKRLWWLVRLCMTQSSEGRAAYARKAGIFAGVGQNVGISPRHVPLYSELIRFHNNIRVARGVEFVTHDTLHRVFNQSPEVREMLGDDEIRFHEHIGCIEIMDNVFLGAKTIVLDSVRIGPNVIVASGSVVVKDLEPNGIYAGVPAKRIGSFDELVRKRAIQEKNGSSATTQHNQKLTPQEIDAAWRIFEEQHATSQ